MGQSVTAAVYDPTNTTEVVEDVGRLVDARGKRAINEPGDGAVTVLSDHDHAADLATPLNVVRLSDGGQLKQAFRVRDVETVEVDRESAKVVRSTGPGLLDRLYDAIICPWKPAGERPLSRWRSHDWGSPGVDAAGEWTDTIHEQSRTTMLWGGSRPVAYLDPYAAWIWGEADDTEHTAGACYYDRSFTLADDDLVVIYGSGDDAFDWRIDGVACLDAEADLDDLSNWWWTWRSPIRLTAGTHTFRAKVTNAASTGPGGFLASAWTVDEAGGIKDLIFITGEPGSTGPGSEAIGDWHQLAYPATPPGLTAGRMVRQWIEEAQVRGAVGEVTLGFDDDEDTDGNPWPVITDQPQRVGAKIGEGLEVLSAAWVDVDVRLGAGVLVDMWDKTAGRGDASGVTYSPANGLTHLSHRVVA